MESNTVISFEVSTNDREDKANYTSKQTDLISLQQSAAEISKQNMNQSSDKNEYSIEKAHVVHVYENSTQVTGEISESGLSKPTQSESINPQTVEEGASYIQMDNYISFLSNDKLNKSETSTNTEAISIKPINAGITKQAKTKATSPSRSNAITTDQSDNQYPENAPTIQETIIDMNDLVNLTSIYEDIMNMAEPEGVSTHEHNREISFYEDIMNKAEPADVSTHNKNTHISSTDQLHQTSVCKTTNMNTKMNKVQPCIMTNRCKLALALLVGIIITVPVISLIFWGVNSRDNIHKKVGPVINITTIDLTECWENSVKYCKNSIVTQLTGNNTTSKNISRHESTTRSGKNISMLTGHETTTGSGQNKTSPGNQKITASIGLTAWATSVVSYSAGTTLIFNGMDEEHNGFDRSTGLFTCPITGIYYVFVTLRKNNSSNIYVDVIKMGTRIIRFSENNTESPWNIVSNSALVSCAMGEIIQMKGWRSGSIYGEASVRYSLFSVNKVDQIAGNSPDQTFVGYSGYANTQSLSRGDPIHFPNPLCNVGNHFSHNRFTCPYTGIYFVGVTYWKYPSTSYSYRVDAHVYRGDTQVLTLLDENNADTYITNNALVRCYRWEYIETKAHSTSYWYGSGSYPESIFTVMSVHQEDPTRPFIGFSKYKTGVEDYSAGDVITFTGIILNNENYFKANQFVCPVNGSYYFLLNLQKFLTYNMEAYLKHGDQTVFKLEDTQSSNSWTKISNSAVIRCLKDEVVAVVAAGPCAVNGYQNHKMSTFSGFLLLAD